jgi:hypothetical protein
VATATEKLGSDLMKQAMDSFSGVMRTGLKMQEEAAQWWLDAIGDVGSPNGMQKKAQEFMSSAVPVLQHNAQECLKVLDQNSRNSLDLLKKAYEAAQSESVAEVQAKLREMWESSLAEVRANVQSVVQLNTRMMQTCNDFLSKEPVNGKVAPSKG